MAYIKKNIGTEVARMAGIQPHLDAAANEVLAKAKGLAAQHANTGSYASSLHVESAPGKRGVTDRLVVADDPAAVPIEYGHKKKSGKKVPGQHILGKAAGMQ